MIVLQRLWVANGCGPMARMKVSSFFFFFSWFFLGPMAVVHLLMVVVLRFLWLLIWFMDFGS